MTAIELAEVFSRTLRRGLAFARATTRQGPGGLDHRQRLRQKLCQHPVVGFDVDVIAQANQQPATALDVFVEPALDATSGQLLGLGVEQHHRVKLCQAAESLIERAGHKLELRVVSLTRTQRHFDVVRLVIAPQVAWVAVQHQHPQHRLDIDPQVALVVGVQGIGRQAGIAV